MNFRADDVLTEKMASAAADKTVFQNSNESMLVAPSRTFSLSAFWQQGKKQLLNQALVFESNNSDQDRRRQFDTAVREDYEMRVVFNL